MRPHTRFTSMAGGTKRAGLLGVLIFAAIRLGAAADSWTLMDIRVEGSKEYRTEEVVHASGLAVGRPVTQDDLRAASRRLVSTGAFGHVSSAFQGQSGTGIAVTFTIEDALAYLPLRFENFVWAKDAELLAYLRERVPLFHGRATQSEELLNRIDEALTRWLSVHGVHGSAGHRFHAATESGRIDAVSFEVQGVPMTVRAVTWIDAPSLDASDRSTLESLVVGSTYESTALRETLDTFVARAYGRLGRLKARGGTIEPRLAGPPAASVDLVVAITVVEGPVYTVGSVEWKSAVKEEDRPRLRVRPGA